MHINYKIPCLLFQLSFAFHFYIMTNLKKNPKRLVLNLASTTTTAANVQVPSKEQQTKNDLYQKGPACILPNLYLGSYYNALNVTQLNQLDINCIINVASEINIVTRVPVIDYHHMRWTHSQSNLAHAEFAQAISKIQTAHSKKQNVLIHCQQGIERSAALVIAFLLCSSRQAAKIITWHNSLAGQNWTLDRALEYVQDRAPGIRPNMELLYELREYEKLIVPKRQTTIQTRTRRSESITCCKPSISNKPNVNHHQRPRASSFRDDTTTPNFTFLIHNKKKTPNHHQQQSNKLATAALLLIILTVTAIHQQQQKLGDEQGIVNPSFFLKPVYPIF